jgi:uncharacterized protein YraI
MRKQLMGVVFAVLVGGLAAPPPAEAQTQAFTTMTVNLYAGPSGDYPIVAQVPGGVSLLVMGCLTGFSWCDVSLPGLRGWVWGDFLTSPWQGRSVPLVTYGAAIGLPIVTFSLGAYWGNFYRDRPWFRNQAHWMRRPPPRPVRPPGVGRPPPRPPGPGARPPNRRPPGNNAAPGGGRPGGGGPGAGGGRPGGGGGPGAGGGNRPPGGGPGAGGGNRGARGGGNRPPGGGGGGGGGGNRPPPGGGG